MSDFNLTNKVVQDNNLIQAINKLDRTTFKVFEMAVSCIDTKNPKQEIVLKKSDIFNFFELKSRDKYTRMEQVMKRLSQQGIVLNLPDKRKRLINVTSTLEWGENTDTVEIRFNTDIMPYLIDLKSNFTQYQITEIKGLNSKYSLILFKWLMMKHNSYQRTPEISMEDLREITDTVNEYSEFRDFNKKVLQVAEKEINANTTLKVSYEKIARKGRKITSIKWNIKEKDKDKAIDVSVDDVNSAENDLNGLYGLFMFELRKDLSLSDKTVIQGLYKQYGFDNVVSALREAIIKQTTSLRYIEQILVDSDDYKIGEKAYQDFEKSGSEANDFSELLDEYQISVDDLLVESAGTKERKSKWKFWNKK